MKLKVQKDICLSRKDICLSKWWESAAQDIDACSIVTEVKYRTFRWHVSKVDQGYVDCPKYRNKQLEENYYEG